MSGRRGDALHESCLFYIGIYIFVILQHKQYLTIMAHSLDPGNDLTFKRVFGEHKHLCISLLNSMLPLDRPVAGIE